jgi:alpha-tubulin suppressor-like RCC1 family protein
MKMKRLSLYLALLLPLFMLFSVLAGPKRAEAESNNFMISTGKGFTIALKHDGTVWSWGGNIRGQLGDGTSDDSTTPRQVGLTQVVSIASGYSHTIALKSDGTVWAWGDNVDGQLGDGTNLERNAPVQVTGLTGVVAIDAGYAHNLALKDDGTVWTWGRNNWGQLGHGNTPGSNTPIQVDNLTGVKTIAAGYDFSVAVKDDGTIWGWGNNISTQIGNAASASQLTPVQINGIVWQEGDTIIANSNATFVLKADGTVWGLGNGLGDGIYIAYPPRQILTLSDVAAISSTTTATLILKSDGTVWAFGENNQGQLGIGNKNSQTTPVQVSGLTDIVAIEAGNEHAFAIQSDGTLWAWGKNDFGQYGNGTKVPSTSPVQMNFKFAASDASLSTLSLSAGTLSPAFDPKTFNYKATVANEIDSVTVTATPNHSLATIISGTGTVNLNVGDNPVKIEVKAESGKVAIYVITVTRAPSDNAELSALTVSAGSLSPAFSPEKQAYTVSVGNEVKEMTVTAAVYDSTASLKINGVPVASGTPSGAIALPVGDTKISVEVTAESGKVVTYVITVTRAPSDNAELSALTVSAGSLSPAFSPEKQAYTVSVGNEVKEMTVTAAVYDSTASLKINGVPVASGTPSGAIALPVGDTKISVEVTAESGKVVTYVITVTRAPSNNADLAALTVSAGSLSPAFSPEKQAYTVSVGNEVKEMTVTAAVYDSTASLKINGVPAASGTPSGAIALPVGNTTISVEVTAEDGYTTKTYQITVTRQPASGSSSTPSSSSTNEPSATGVSVKLFINGNLLEGIASVARTEQDGRLTALVTVDASRLSAMLGNEAEGVVVRISVEEDVHELVVSLSGDAIDAFDNKQATLVVASPAGTYYLPVSEVNRDQWPEQLAQTALHEIRLQISIARSREEQEKRLEDAAKQRRFTIVAPPVDFAVSVSHDGHTFGITGFSKFVKREIPLAASVAKDDVSTAVHLQEDGTVHQVPTYFEMRDGKMVAVIHSLSNSIYALVHYATEFADAKNHWARTAIHDLASRMIASGMGDGRFNPDASVTRAELAALAIRALGLAGTNDVAPFGDVKSGNWFASSVATAKAYGLVSGYEDGNFRPADTITRQEAAVIFARMMQLAGMDMAVSEEEADSLLSGFADGTATASWARLATAALIKQGIVVGSEGRLHMADEITRAETAVILSRLLQQAGLIDKQD